MIRERTDVERIRAAYEQGAATAGREDVGVLLTALDGALQQMHELRSALQKLEGQMNATRASVEKSRFDMRRLVAQGERLMAIGESVDDNETRRLAADEYQRAELAEERVRELEAVVLDLVARWSSEESEADSREPEVTRAAVQRGCAIELLARARVQM
jgi:multidrug resistance efflux pump